MRESRRVVVLREFGTRMIRSTANAVALAIVLAGGVAIGVIAHRAGGTQLLSMRNVDTRCLANGGLVLDRADASAEVDAATASRNARDFDAHDRPVLDTSLAELKSTRHQPVAVPLLVWAVLLGPVKTNPEASVVVPIPGMLLPATSSYVLELVDANNGAATYAFYDDVLPLGAARSSPVKSPSNCLKLVPNPRPSQLLKFPLSAGMSNDSKP